ncbi:hypothetical protein ACH5RR_020061 [Cinchona calisaya]|uniref:Uncharacterized protein n=1 Tax=Cinchona calisaya TaxID=153742 RepID=A0ABD2ZH72_9GENT
MPQTTSVDWAEQEQGDGGRERRRRIKLDVKSREGLAERGTRMGRGATALDCDVTCEVLLISLIFMDTFSKHLGPTGLDLDPIKRRKCFVPPLSNSIHHL